MNGHPSTHHPLIEFFMVDDREIDLIQLSF
jgi:hypothetical protein